MKTCSHITDGIKIIKIEGGIDRTNIADLKKLFTGFMNYSTFYLDLSGVSFVNSSFINLLFSFKQDFPRSYGLIKLVNPNDNVLELLTLTGIEKTFEVFAGNLVPIRRTIHEKNR